MVKISLAALAQQAIAAQETGKTHADLALEGEQMSPQQLAAIEQAALAGDEQYKQALGWLKEAREATFTDAFARAAYFRGRIKSLAEEEFLDPEKVLSTLFSAQGTKMFVRGEKEPKPAIPLFRTLEDKREAQKYLGKNVFPIRMPNSYRKEQGSSREHISGDSFKFLVPTTAADAECYEHLRRLLARMPGVLASYFEEHTNYDVRQAVWLVLHLVYGARVFHPGTVKRIFEEKDGLLEHKNGSSFLPFELSGRETLVLDYLPINRRVVDRLKVFATAVERIIKK